MPDVPTRTPIGQPHKTDTVKTACPDCGVVQEVSVLTQKYEKSPDSAYVNRECPICGYNDVWFQ